MWKDIDGYEGYYQISDSGMVRTLDRYVRRIDGYVQKRKARNTRMFINKDGYCKVKLNKDGKSKEFFVHRLVAQAFIENPDNKLEVNHIDFDRTNNRASNLEWVSHSENIHKTVDAGRHVTQLYDFSGENNPNYGNHILHERYQRFPEEIEKLVHRGALNSKSRPVCLTHKDTERVFESMTECAAFLKQEFQVEGAILTVQQKVRRCAENGNCVCHDTHVRFI